MFKINVHHPDGRITEFSARSEREAARKAEKALRANASHVEIDGPEGSEFLTIEDFDFQVSEDYGPPMTYPSGYTDADFYHDRIPTECAA
jgi:hypothetical protein